MKKYLLLPLLLLSLLVSSCGTVSTVPVTGRQHSLLVDDAQVLSLSTQQYAQFMQKATKSKDATKTEMVKRVGQRLASAVEAYLVQSGFANEVKNFAWEFNLVQSNEVNAFCMPGGKIVVYEGLLPITQDEASLAVVLGHEIAHAVAKHSAEQMSTQLRQQYGTQILTELLGQYTGASVAGIAQVAAQAGFSFANLKYSRENETEADYMGLIFMAMAGYNPEAAIPFWQRMAAGKQQQSDILSDHPSDEKRIAALQQAMPTAKQVYNAATGNTSTSQKSATSSTSKAPATKASTTKKSTATTHTRTGR